MEVIRAKKLKLRNTHSCYGCLNKIEKCEVALVETIMGNDKIWNVYTCLECVDYILSKCINCKDSCTNGYGEYNEGYIFYCKEDNSK